MKPGISLERGQSEMIVYIIKVAKMPLMRILGNLYCDCAQETIVTQIHGSTQQRKTKHIGISFSELNSYVVSHKPDSNLCALCESGCRNSVHI